MSEKDLTVKRTNNIALNGLQGIVIQETAGTFTISTSKDTIKGELLSSFQFEGDFLKQLRPVLPKSGTIFDFVLPLAPSKRQPMESESRTLTFEISGNQFSHRAADRVTRKFKAKRKGEFAPNGLECTL